MSEMSKLFHIDKPESVRYERYRGIVSKHKDKIKEFLSRLKKTERMSNQLPDSEETFNRNGSIVR